MSLRAPLRSYKSTDDRDWPICCSLLDAESAGFVRKGCDAALLLYSQSNMIEQVVTCCCLFVYLESKNKQANLPNYMVSTKKENKV